MRIRKKYSTTYSHPLEEKASSKARPKPSLGFQKNWINWGMNKMALAKMTGITPLMATLTGRKVLWPPYILRPTTFLAYCTGMRRSASFIKTMTQMTTRNSTTNSGARTRYWPAVEALSIPSCMYCHTVPKVTGSRATIPANRMMEMPLPTPLSLICSPIHMIRAVPAVKVSTMTKATNTPAKPSVYSTMPWLRR